MANSIVRNGSGWYQTDSSANEGYRLPKAWHDYSSTEEEEQPFPNFRDFVLRKHRVLLIINVDGMIGAPLRIR